VAYGEYAMKKFSIFEWHRRLKEGRDVQDDPKSGQPKPHRTDANVDRVRTLLYSLSDVKLKDVSLLNLFSDKPSNRLIETI
jgi:hypothetical protein